MQPLDLLLEAVHAHSQEQHGRTTLIEAIPIKLYDEEFANSDERQTCVTWIKENRSLWEPLSMPYIKDGIKPKVS